jgi:hypothetical protein
MENINEKETLLRILAGSPVARNIAERALKLEDQATEEERQGKRKYPGPVLNGMKYLLKIKRSTNS